MLGVNGGTVCSQTDGKLTSVIADRHGDSSIGTYRRDPVNLFHDNITSDPFAPQEGKSTAEPLANISDVGQHHRAQYRFEVQKRFHRPRNPAQNPEQLETNNPLAVVQHVAGLLVNRLQQLTRIFTIFLPARDQSVAHHIRGRHIVMHIGSHAQRYCKADPASAERYSAASIPLMNLQNHFPDQQIINGCILLCRDGSQRTVGCL